MQPHHPSFEGEAHNLVSNLIFLGRFPTKVLHFLRLKHQKHFCTWPLAMPLDCTGQRKKTKWRRRNGGSPCYVKMTSFVQIVRVADR